MPEIPDCLNRRYRALDELVKELNTVSDIDFNDETSGACCSDPGVKLMCQFWKILKEDPDCNLRKAVEQRMNAPMSDPKDGMFGPQNVSCYMAAHNCMKKDDDTSKKKEPEKPKIKNCCHSSSEPTPKTKCCASKSATSSNADADVLPLSKVLCNLKEAASFDRKCQGMIADLMMAQKKLQDQIQHLEHREKEGIQMLKQADCMWSCMEDAYKKKILESQERQQELIKQLKEAETHTNRWRKNKKDLEFQLENINMCHQEVSEKRYQKENDLKCMKTDIAGYKKRIENSKKELDAAKKSLATKKRTSEDKIKKISGDISRREAMIKDERARKEEKDSEGNSYIKEARADLLNLGRVLIQKKLEYQEMKTNKETLIEELELLSQTYDQCKDRCQNKKQSIENELKTIDHEIANYKVKCIRCHQCTDTVDIRKFCTDCPRCLEERECLNKEDHCSVDHSMDCVCMSVKQKLMDNVFENMYTVLERQIKTGPGKAVAEAVLNCLKKSRNGKLDQMTRQILQDFILTAVKKNLTLTIVGGAVKTRCELDSDTYKQLMLCLKQVKAVRPPKADKQTAAKKEPCRRWGGTSECNCPKGPKACICVKKAPPPPEEPGPCPPPDKEDKVEVQMCPHKESTACGPDCAMHAVPSAVGTDVAAWRPDPCQGPTCNFKNMRAAQCVLGPEALNALSSSRTYVTAVPYVPKDDSFEEKVACTCGSPSKKPCDCDADTKQMKVVTVSESAKKTCGVLHSLPEENNLYIISPEKHVIVDSNSCCCHKPVSKQLVPRESLIVDNKVKQDLINEQFKSVLVTKSIQESNHFETESEASKNIEPKQSSFQNVEIDEKMLELIEGITAQNPNHFVSLKKTESGRLSLGLNSISEDNDIIIKRSPSGNMIIEIDKNALQTSISKKKPEGTKFSEDEKVKKLGLRHANVGTETHSKYTEISLDNDSESLLHNSEEGVNGYQTMRKITHLNLLQERYRKGERNINVDVKYENRQLCCHRANLIRTSSENIAIHVNNPGITSYDRIEFPVLLYMTRSGTVNIHFQNEAISNTVAARTASDGFLIYERPFDYHENLKQDVSRTDKIVKMKLKGLDNTITEPPAVIKKTPSGNYDIILEKEFENSYKQAIKRQVGEENGSFFEIVSTPSGIVLDFGKNDHVGSNSKKALLMKSHSGILKIIVSDSDQSIKENMAQKKMIASCGSVMSAKALRELLRKLPCMNQKFQKSDPSSTSAKRSKTRSDSHLYEAWKSKFRSNQSILENSSTTLKKTESGQYAVVLDKDSKKSFINNLLSYIDKSSKSLIPIQHTDSGEITIVLSKDMSDIGGNGSLKITASGNLYIILDESAFNRLSNNVGVSTSHNVKNGEVSPYISKIKNPENKAIATNCNARPDDVLCDSSKCVCEKYVTMNCAIKDIYPPKNWDEVNISDSKIKGCKSKCSLCDKQNINSNNKPPHIVIKAGESRPVPDKGNKLYESYYCEVQSICSYHKDRYEAVSNELLEISSLCNKPQKEVLSKIITQIKPMHIEPMHVEPMQFKPIKQKTIVQPIQDSLDYLPHQLPPFLRNITYN